MGQNLEGLKIKAESEVEMKSSKKDLRELLVWASFFLANLLEIAIG